MIRSNINVSGVRDQVRGTALCSFSFFANTVLGYCFSEELTQCVQDVVEDEEDFVIKTLSPRSLMAALQAWLRSRGVLVLSSVELPQHEILTWLEFDREVPGGQAVTLELLSTAVSVKWLQ